MIEMAGNKIMQENDRCVYKKNMQIRSRYVLDVHVKKVYVKRPYEIISSVVCSLAMFQWGIFHICT